MTDDEDEEPNHLIDLMALRENMQEFPGRVPQRKRKKESESPQQDGSKPKVRISLPSSSEVKVLTPRRFAFLRVWIGNEKKEEGKREVI